MPENAPRVSVVVPIYNVERYLPGCLDAILGQTLSDIEVICVNDGSTDGSGETLASYAARDARIVALDGPNGGYGHAVNRGLDAARGEYVGIVEPDDLVDKHMYEELLHAATLPDGSRADVVKGSYWNYYDLEDGSAPYIEPSNLMSKMPSEPCVIDVHDNCEVLFHHPSVWSAIYRRDFLAEKGIRMIEPKGAGWADNPWFFETLCQAGAISWVPGAYYYYRQTNPDASSYLKDYHLPFDRLRDIRALLDRIGERDPKVLACFYNREFSYIKSVLEKFDFPESDPELFSLIRETLASMDRDVLYGAKRGIRRDQIEYYEDVMGISAQAIRPHGPSANPQVSVIVPMMDVRPYVIPCLSSLCAQTLGDFEVIAVDCGSRDRTVEVAGYFAKRDLRFRVIRSGGGSVSDGFAEGLSEARGEIVLCLDPRTTLGRKFLSRVARSFRDAPDADLLVFANELRYLPKKVLGTTLQDKRAVCVDAEGIRARLMIAAPNSVTSKAFRRAFLSGLEGPFSHDEGTRCTLTSTKALATCGRVALLPGAEPKRQTYRSVRTPLALIKKASLLEQARRAKFDLVAAYAERTGSPEVQRGFHCYAVEAILRDLDEIGDVEQERAYISTLKRDCLDRYGLLDLPASHFFNSESYARLQRLSHLDYGRYLVRETDASRRRERVIAESTAYRIGKKIAKIGPSLLPRGLATKVRMRV